MGAVGYKAHAAALCWIAGIPAFARVRARVRGARVIPYSTPDYAFA
jgi:hypothetical protein